MCQPTRLLSLEGLVSRDVISESDNVAKCASVPNTEWVRLQMSLNKG